MRLSYMFFLVFALLILLSFPSAGWAQDASQSVSNTQALQMVGVGFGSIFLTNLLKRITPSIEKSSAMKRILPIAGCVAGAFITGLTNGVPLAHTGDMLLTGVATGLAAQGTYQTGPVINQGLSLLSGMLFPKKK